MNERERIKVYYDAKHLIENRNEKELEKMLDYALKKGFDVNFTPEDEKPLLAIAVEKKVGVHVLLERGADPNKEYNITWEDGMIKSTPFIDAVTIACNGSAVHRGYVEEMLKRGADPNVEQFTDDSSEKWRTPVICLCAKQQNKVALETMELLLKYGADANAKAYFHHDFFETTEVWTPIIFAAKSNNLDALALLSKYGGKIDFQEETDRLNTPFFRALEKMNDETFDFLLKQKILDVEAVNKWGETLLIMVTRKSWSWGINKMRILLRNWADPNKPDGDGKTPLEYVIDDIRYIDSTNVDEDVCKTMNSALRKIRFLLLYGADIEKVATTITNIDDPIVRRVVKTKVILTWYEEWYVQTYKGVSFDKVRKFVNAMEGYLDLLPEYELEKDYNKAVSYFIRNRPLYYFDVSVGKYMWELGIPPDERNRIWKKLTEKLHKEIEKLLSEKKKRVERMERRLPSFIRKKIIYTEVLLSEEELQRAIENAFPSSTKLKEFILKESGFSTTLKPPKGTKEKKEGQQLKALSN